MPTSIQTTDAQAILKWYEALPETPAYARDTDRRAAQWFLERDITLKEVIGGLLLGAARRKRRDPGLPPLQPISSLAYFAPVVREVLGEEDGLDPGYMSYLYEVVFDAPPSAEEAWKAPPPAPGGR